MLRKLLRVLGIVLAAAIVIGAALLLYLEPYVTYDRDGAHLSLKKNAQDPDGTGATAALPEVSDAQIVYDEAQPGSDRIADLGGVYVTTQMLRDPEAVRAALAGGVDSIEHGAKMDEETIRLYKERGAFVCTTISPALPYALFDPAISGASEKDQYNGRIVFDGVVESARTALANGIPVGLGNDVGCPYITQYDFWRELCYFHKYCGVSNQFALHTATLRNARLAGVGDVTGSIEAGKSADFIVTRKNPLDDLTALRQLELVVCRGRAVHKPAPKRNKTVNALLDPYLA